MLCNYKCRKRLQSHHSKRALNKKRILKKHAQHHREKIIKCCDFIFDCDRYLASLVSYTANEILIFLKIYPHGATSFCERAREKWASLLAIEGREREKTFLRRVNIFIIISIHSQTTETWRWSRRGGENDAGSKCEVPFCIFEYHMRVNYRPIQRVSWDEKIKIKCEKVKNSSRNWGNIMRPTNKMI